MAILIDTFNLFHCTRLRHSGKTIDYKKLLAQLKETYPDELKITSYVVRTQKSESFIRFLQNDLKLFVRMKEIRNAKNDNFDVELTLDALDSQDETIVICSSSLNLIPLVSRLHSDRRIVYIHASGIPQDFNDYCVAKELSAKVMKDETATPVT